MKKTISLTGSFFLPCITAILLITQNSPVFAQTYWNNQGAKIHIGGKSVITGTNTTIISDSNTVIENHGKIKVTEMQNSGALVMKDTNSTLIIDSMLLLEKGKLTLNGTLIILRGDTLALQVTNGQIVAENSAAKIKWHIGESTGRYVLPFFTKNLQDVKVILSVLNAGNGEGNFEVRTFSSNPNSIPNNRTYPNELNTYADTSDWFDNSLHTADRYWKVSASNYNSNPVSNLSLTYSNEDIGNENTIQEEQLFALQWNGTGWDTLAGTVDTTANTYELDSIGSPALLIIRDVDTSCATIANFTSSVDTAYLGDDVSFTNTSVNAESYQWRINNGIVSEDTNYAYYFRATEKYVVTLIAMGDDSCKSISNKVFNVKRKTGHELPQTEHSLVQQQVDTGTAIPQTHVYDRFGNTYLLDDIEVPGNSMVGGIFTLHFYDEDNSLVTGFNDTSASVNPSNCIPPCSSLGEERRWLGAKVFEDLSHVLVQNGDPTKLPKPYPSVGVTPVIHIDVRSDFLPNGDSIPPGAGGVASQYYLYSGTGIFHGVLWQMITTGWDPFYNFSTTSFPSSFFLGFISIRFDNPNLHWYSDYLDTAIVSNETDLYSVVLHESLHALGFASLINQNGTGLGGYAAYSLFDTYLNLNGSTPLISSSSNFGYDVFLNVPTSNLASGCDSVFFLGNGTNNSNQEIYSPASWQRGSSLSHFNCDSSGCPAGNGYVMNYCSGIAANSIQRFPHIAETQTLCDLGYLVRDTFGTGVTQHIYSGTTCSANNPMNVAGVNDFRSHSPFNTGSLFTVQAGQIIVFTATGANNILINDQNAEEIANPKIVYPTGGDIINPTASSFGYQPPSDYGGPAVLKYRPYNATNDVYGNVTYIFLNVTVPPLPPCDPNDCNKICHGDFEVVTHVNAYPMGDIQYPTSSSNVDLYTPARRSSFYNYWPPCQDSSSVPYPANGDKYIGAGGGPSWGEGVFFQLNSPLIAGGTYKISFLGIRPHRVNEASYCSQSLRHNMDYFFSVNKPCNRPTPICITDSCTASCNSYDFDVIKPDTTGGTINPFYVTDTIWTVYSTTWTVPAGTLDLNYFMFHTGYPAGNIGGFTYVDSIAISEVNYLPIKTTPQVSDESPCMGDTIVLNYTLCIDSINGDTTNVNPVNLNLTLPPDFVISGGDFNQNGDFTIAANALTDSCNYNLTANVIVNGFTGVQYNIRLIATSGACVLDTNSISTVQIVPGGELSVDISIADNDSIFDLSDTIVFSVVVCNLSSTVGANNVTVRDTLPVGLDFINSFSSDFSESNGIVSSISFDLPVSTCDTFYYAVIVTSNCGWLPNCAVINEGEGSCTYISDCVNLNISDTVARWPKHSPGNLLEQAHGIATDSTGVFYLAGAYTGAVYFPLPFNKPAPVGMVDVFLAKYGNCSTPDWVAGVKTLSGGAQAYHPKIITDASGNLIVAGDFSGTIELAGTGTFKDTLTSVSGSSDIFIAKYDSSGSLLWAVRDGGTNSEELVNVTVDGQGAILIAGFYADSTVLVGISLTGAGQDGTNGFVAKYSNSGSGQWADELKVTGAGTHFGFARGVGTFNDTVFIAGELDNDVYIEKLEPSGTSVFDTVYAEGSAQDLTVDNDGNFIITGQFGQNLFVGTAEELGAAGSNPDAFAAKFSSSGILLWADNFGGNGSPIPLAIASGDSNAVFITGAFAGTMLFDENFSSAGDEDIFVAKYSASGDKKWLISAGGADSDKPLDIISVPGIGYIYVSGSFNDSILFNTTLFGNADFFAARIRDYGSSVEFQKLSWSAENNEDENRKPSGENKYGFNLYPNPAENTVTLKTDFPGNVTLFLYDLVGAEKLMQIIQDNEEVSVRKFADGAYLFQIRSNNKAGEVLHQGKLLIIR
ncbi:MAG: T9SS type A sorting domain-containing protein [Chitinophagales bacterium]|nr:T9SS type A sorting domain-containing protein [Chitinophagales bacterium]